MTTTRPIPNETQAAQDYKALCAFTRLKSYEAVAKELHCSKTTAFERVQRALQRADPNDSPSNRSDF